jgi:hypothetical protein
MKKILFLLLFPTFAVAQYTGNANQKITLGEQTTADGLVYRGLAADTTRKPSVDTMAYIILDTTTNLLWHYKKATSNKWLQAGGGDTSSIAYVNTYGTQTVNGSKTFNDTVIINKSLKIGSNVAYLLSNGTGNYFFTKNFKNQNGLYHIAIGDNVLSNATTVSNPTSSRHGSIAIGYNNLKNLTQSASTNQGVYNSSIGYLNMESVTTGNFNTSIGALSLKLLTTGTSNVAVGTTTLENITTGSNNLGIGDGALRFAASSSSSNVAIGSGAGIFDAINGNQVTSVDNSIYIGQRADPSATTGVINEIVLGKDAKGQGSNTIMLGNSSVSTTNGIYCYDTAISSPSDERDKTNIENLNTGLNLILALRPVKFTWNMRDFGNVGNKDIGFIAQEVELVQNIGNEAANIKLVDKSVADQYWMQRDNLIPIIVKAMQEQQAIIKALEEKILTLENK